MAVQLYVNKFDDADATFDNSVFDRSNLVADETVNISDVAPVKDITAGFSETMDVSESMIKSATKGFTESMDVDDGLIKSGTKNFNETFNVDESVLKAVTREFIDSLDVSESVSKKAMPVFTETMSVNDTLEYTKPGPPKGLEVYPDQLELEVYET